MALKDWKKFDKDKWWKSYTSRSVQRISIDKYDNYEVWWSVNPLSAGNHIKKLRTFKNKALAFKYAKAWMEKH